MGRPSRVQAPNVVYHVINRGNKRAKVFHQQNDYSVLQRLLLKAKKMWPVRLYYYVFMPNHFHLMLEPQEEGVLSRFMQYVSSKYAIRLNAELGTDGHIWQGRYRSYVIDKDAYFLQCGKYIELNPVRAHLVVDPEKYQWSSYRFHAYGLADPLVDPDDLYLGLASNPVDLQIQYRKLLIEDLVSVR
jgi:putative transposase